VDACADKECGEPEPGIVCGQCQSPELCGTTGRCFLPGTCPSEMVEVGDTGVCIDALEATTEQVAAFLNAHGNDCKVEGYRDMHGKYECSTLAISPEDSNYHILLEADVFSAVPGFETHPAVGVTFFGARFACESWGKRLCGKEEWERACGGPEGFLYPYGDTYDASMCNTCSDSDGCEGPYDPLPVGSFPDCEGGYPGLFDMSGNVREWIDFCWRGEVWDLCAVIGGTVSFSDRAMCLLPDPIPEGRLYDQRIYDWSGRTGFRCCLTLD